MPGKRLGNLKLKVPGEYNLLNALAAGDVTELGVPVDDAPNYLKFTGVRRRFGKR